MGWHARSGDLGLQDVVAVVIGASEGIGAAIAVGLAEAGSIVAIGGRSEERLAATAREIESRGGSVLVEEVEAREPEDIRRFAKAIGSQLDAPTVLVNSMGGQIHMSALEVGVDEWEQMHQTHLRGTFFSCQAFAPAMIDRGYGKMINLSSTYSVAVVEGRSTYASAKGGVSLLTAALALEWAPFGIGVNALAPGATRTPRVVRRFEADPSLEERLVEDIPIGRVAEPDDIVGPALFLASPMSDYVTGQTLLVDGGWARSK